MISTISNLVFEFHNKSLTCPAFFKGPPVTLSVDVTNITVSEGLVKCNKTNMKLTTDSQELGDVCGKHSVFLS